MELVEEKNKNHALFSERVLYGKVIQKTFKLVPMQRKYNMYTATGSKTSRRYIGFYL